MHYKISHRSNSSLSKNKEFFLIVELHRAIAKRCNDAHLQGNPGTILNKIKEHKMIYNQT